MLTRLSILLFTVCLVSGAADSADRTIYRCVLAGVTTFSDRPCGDSIEVHSLEVPTAAVGAMGPPPVLNGPARRQARSTKAKPSDHPPVDHRDRQVTECKRLDAQLRQVAARMRAGYKARVGERLRAQQRVARARRRELRCR
jgi:hypothetical protein